MHLYSYNECGCSNTGSKGNKQGEGREGREGALLPLCLAVGE